MEIYISAVESSLFYVKTMQRLTSISSSYDGTLQISLYNQSLIWIVIIWWIEHHDINYIHFVWLCCASTHSLIDFLLDLYLEFQANITIIIVAIEPLSENRRRDLKFDLLWELFIYVSGVFKSVRFITFWMVVRI